MKRLVFSVILLYSSLADADSDLQQWEQYKLEYSKIYDSCAEEVERFANFQRNLKIVNEHNAMYKKREVSWKMKMTELADSVTDTLSAVEDFPTMTSRFERSTNVEQPIERADVPESFDWRNLNAVLPPRKMETEEHSWAFAVAAAAEVGLSKFNGTLEYLSVQQMLDCCSSQNIFGGMYYCSFDGITSEESYVYTGIEQICQWVPARVFITYRYHASSNETHMQALIAQKGLLTVSIDGSNLSFYDSGIIDGSQCEQIQKNYTKSWDAAIVGYGTENGMDYWILKNFLGTDWGEGGYFRLKRNVNACGISNDVWSLEVVGHTG